MEEPFLSILNAHGDKNIEHTEICTAERLLPDPNAFEFRIAFDKLKCTNQQVLIKFRQN
jgi:hypothetical protein